MEIRQIIVGKFQTNCYLFISGKEMAVIDPGGEPRKILAEMEKTGTEAKYIINTHYHFDHMLANKEIEEVTGAKVLVHENEKNFIAFEPDHFLKDGEIIKIGAESLEVIHTPGHSQGSICLLGKGFIFSGDTLFNGSYGRVDFPGGSAEDIAKSLEKLAEIITPGMKVCPGHGQVFYR
jgi:glyoxylase-like metal-dependent hydrolase (beta-lactamase superfamily II)